MSVHEDGREDVHPAESTRRLGREEVEGREHIGQKERQHAEGRRVDPRGFHKTVFVVHQDAHYHTLAILRVGMSLCDNTTPWFWR